MSQSGFHTALLDAAVPVPEGLTDGAGRPAGRRFGIYRNNVAVSLSEALASGFPSVEKLLGAENFARVAGAFLRTEPPRSPLMMHYGAGFPDFLETLPALASKGYLGDCARLDLALRRAYHAADAKPIEPEDLAQIAPDQLGTLRLWLAPAVQILRSDWPVFDIRRFPLAEGAPQPRAEAQALMVLRPGFDPYPTLMPEGSVSVLSRLTDGATLSEAQDHAAPDFDLPGLLALLLGGQAITRIQTTES